MPRELAGVDAGADDGGVAEDVGVGSVDDGDAAGVGDVGAAAAGARGFLVKGGDGAAGAAGGCLGGLPRRGLVAAGVSASMAAGWQFSQ